MGRGDAVWSGEAGSGVAAVPLEAGCRMSRKRPWTKLLTLSYEHTHS